MVKLRPSADRGHTKLAWLDSRHTFSFGDYHDPQHMGFSHLRVINEDRVKPGAGFDTHSHRDMEIVTYVLEGALAHKDSTGINSVIRVGEVQRMSAGTGIRHSEYNASPSEPVHFLQIWIIPNQTGLPPGYEQRAYRFDDERGKFMLVASENGREGSVTVHQDVDIWAARFAPGEESAFRLKPNRQAWLHSARGGLSLNGTLVHAGDGAAINAQEVLDIKAIEESEVLLFDLV